MMSDSREDIFKAGNLVYHPEDKHICFINGDGSIVWLSFGHNGRLLPETTEHVNGIATNSSMADDVRDMPSDTTERWNDKCILIGTIKDLGELMENRNDE